jgi:hypothetical protein
MRITRAGVLLVAVACVACGSTRSQLITPYELSDHEWRRLYTDQSYVVSLDVEHVNPGPEDDSVAVWYETRHLAEREHEGQPWNREVIHSLLRCEPLSFKTVLTTIFLDQGPPIAQIGGRIEDILDQPWRPVGPGSVDEGAMRAACSLLQGL